MITRRAVLVLLAVPCIARAEPEALAAISKAREKMKSLSGPFTQARTIGLLKSVVSSRGVLTLALPDRLRWELLPPDEVTYWVTPDGLAYRGRGGSARVSATQSPRLSAALADLHALLGDLGPLRTRYELALKNPTTIEATPRDPKGAPFKQIILELAADLVRPTRVTLIEGPRDRTEITFGELVVNGPIDPRLLEPPR
jgi:outer membrane lipoprotein-sorting protein